MLEDASNAHLIAWTEPNGMSFQVLAPTEFSLRLLPTQFKHKNFSSFIRQLNMYDLSNGNNTNSDPPTSPTEQPWEFKHPLFQRGRWDLLGQIKRK
ncbi:HSF-type DNA-binding-domain-containing protein, partial [Blastocladiella britannica]